MKLERLDARVLVLVALGLYTVPLVAGAVPRPAPGDAGSRALDGGVAKAMADAGVRALDGGAAKAVAEAGVRALDGGLAKAMADAGVRALDGGVANAAADAGVRALDGGVAKAMADAGVRALDGGAAKAAADPAPGGADGGAASAPSAAMTPEVKALVDRVQAFYENTQDFTAQFRQDYAYRTFKRTQTSTGELIYRKPGLMRWSYRTPAEKTFILAGERVLAYDPEARLLTRAAIATHTLSASVTFLFGRGRLAEEFAIARVACADCAGVLLELRPLRPDPRFRLVRLEVDPRSAQVLRSIVVDPDGSENSIRFLELKTNTGVDEKAFKLSIPDGTQVQDFSKRAPGPAAPDGGAGG